MTEIDDAIRAGDANKVKALVTNNQNIVNDKNIQGNTPLHLAVWQGNEEIIKYLLQKKANICAKNNQGDTPLHRAVDKGRLNIIKILITKKSDLDCRNQSGYTALHKAIFQNSTEIARFLIENGADVNIETFNKNKTTPIEFAIKSKCEEIFKLLLEYGAMIPKSQNLSDSFNKILKPFKKYHFEIKKLVSISKTMLDLSQTGDSLLESSPKEIRYKIYNMLLLENSQPLIKQNSNRFIDRIIESQKNMIDFGI